MTVEDGSGIIHADIPNGLISYIHWGRRIEFKIHQKQSEDKLEPLNFEKRVCHCERNAAISRFSHRKRGDYSVDGKTYLQAAPRLSRIDNRAAFGNYAFSIPDSIGPDGSRVSTVSTKCRIKLEAYSSPDPNNPIADYSDSAFAIIASADRHTKEGPKTCRISSAHIGAGV